MASVLLCSKLFPQRPKSSLLDSSWAESWLSQVTFPLPRIANELFGTLLLMISPRRDFISAEEKRIFGNLSSIRGTYLNVSLSGFFLCCGVPPAFLSWRSWVSNSLVVCDLEGAESRTPGLNTILWAFFKLSTLSFRILQSTRSIQHSDFKTYAISRLNSWAHCSHSSGPISEILVFFITVPSVIIIG